MRRVLLRGSLLSACALILTGCAGPQSTLDPAGRGAERLLELFWPLAAGAVAIWIASVALWVWASYGRRRERPLGRRQRDLILVGGGVVVPVALLTVILSYSLAMLPDVLAPAPEGSLRIEVTGHQWWWRVRYLREDAEPIELANEIRLPVGEPVQIELESGDVIHSFWIPSLGGKMDLVPGRRTRLTLEPTREGVYLGPCAEYCGSSHAFMSITAVVDDAEGFRAWLDAQAEPATTPPDSLTTRGRDVFLANGCGACHAVRGTPADGVVGPDLTHVGSRLAIAAGLLENDEAAFRRWVAETNQVKPAAHMPAFGMLPDEDLDALAAYLESLQ